VKEQRYGTSVIFRKDQDRAKLCIRTKCKVGNNVTIGNFCKIRITFQYMEGLH